MEKWKSWLVKNKKSIRITASHVLSGLHFRFTESEENYNSKMIIGKSQNMSLLSTAYDTLHEPIAKQLHFNQYKNSIKMHTSGYAVNCKPGVYEHFRNITRLFS